MDLIVSARALDLAGQVGHNAPGRAVERHRDKDLGPSRARPRQLQDHVSPGRIGEKVRHPAGN